MNAFLLFVPFFLIRFGLMAAIDPQAIRRAAHFAPVQGGEVWAYFIYQAATLGIFLLPFWLRPVVDFSALLYAGVILYAVGLGLLVLTIFAFCSPDGHGFNNRGVYRFSRNPMYVSYFLIFLGVAILTQSTVLFGVVLVFQFSAHWLILAEERECLERFGPDYRQYMERVRRYL